jgi:hypothetical protein
VLRPSYRCPPCAKQDRVLSEGSRDAPARTRALRSRKRATSSPSRPDCGRYARGARAAAAQNPLANGQRSLADPATATGRVRESQERLDGARWLRISGRDSSSAAAPPAEAVGRAQGVTHGCSPGSPSPASIALCTADRRQHARSRYSPGAGLTRTRLRVPFALRATVRRGRACGQTCQMGGLCARCSHLCRSRAMNHRFARGPSC